MFQMKSDHPADAMWDRACELLDRAERMQRRFFRFARTGEIAAWEPPIDVFESDSEVLVRIAVPDVNREDFKIELQGAVLRLSGTRRLPKEAAQRAIRRLEIPYGRIERTLTLPAGRFRLAAHAYTNGCIDIRLQRIGSGE